MRVTSASIAAACLCAFMVASAAAQPTEAEAVDATIACRDISDDLARLTCLDSAVETLEVTRIIREEAIVEKKKNERTFFGLRRKKSEPADEAPLQAESPAEEFGAENLPATRQKRESRQLKNFTANIAEIKLNPYGKATITLDNGQVWRQLDSDGVKLVLSARNRLYTARIKRGLIGNYFLRINELGRSIRVRRIK